MHFFKCVERKDSIYNKMQKLEAVQVMLKTGLLLSKEYCRIKLQK